VLRLNPVTLTVTGRWPARKPEAGRAGPRSCSLSQGPIGAAVWVSQAAEMMGYVQRLDAATMTPKASAGTGGPSSTCVEGTNDVTARLAS